MTETPFALHHEDNASGLVGAVFGDIRRRMTFTPAIFKALAVDPPTLERAWVHARAIVDDPSFPAATARLRAAAGGLTDGAPDPRLAVALAPFVEELPGMVVIVSSFGLALDGRLPLRAPPPLGVEAGTTPPEPTVPEAPGEHPRYASVRELYGTAHVPTLYRSLAALGLLDESWPAIARLLGGPDGRAVVGRVTAAGEREALAFADTACFDVKECRPVLDQFRRALPRNLVVAVTLGGETP